MKHVKHKAFVFNSRRESIAPLWPREAFAYGCSDSCYRKKLSKPFTVSIAPRPACLYTDCMNQETVYEGLSPVCDAGLEKVSFPFLYTFAPWETYQRQYHEQTKDNLTHGNRHRHDGNCRHGQRCPHDRQLSEQPSSVTAKRLYPAAPRKYPCGRMD